jgi:hypothetical protein
MKGNGWQVVGRGLEISVIQGPTLYGGPALTMAKTENILKYNQEIA